MNKITEKVSYKVKPYVFPVGIGVAVVLGLLSAWLTPMVPFLVSLLVIAGLLVGYHNVKEDETHDYVIYTTALVIITTVSGGVLSSVQVVGKILESILTAMLAFITPSAIVVGIRAVVRLARD